MCNFPSIRLRLSRRNRRAFFGVQLAQPATHTPHPSLHPLALFRVLLIATWGLQLVDHLLTLPTLSSSLLPSFINSSVSDPTLSSNDVIPPSDDITPPPSDSLSISLSITSGAVSEPMSLSSDSFSSSCSWRASSIPESVELGVSVVSLLAAESLLVLCSVSSINIDAAAEYWAKE